MPDPPMPSTTMLRIDRRRREAASACTFAGGLVRGRQLLGQSRRPRRGSRSESVDACSRDVVEGRRDAFGLGLGDSRSCSASSTVSASSISMIGMSSCTRYRRLQPRVVQRVLVGEVEQRALVLGAGEDLEQLRVQRHREFLRSDSCLGPSASTSAVCASHAARSAASRLRRSNGSVLLGRRLNHQSPSSTVSPSRRSCSRVAVRGRDASRSPRRDRRHAC